MRGVAVRGRDAIHYGWPEMGADKKIPEGANTGKQSPDRKLNRFHQFTDPRLFGGSQLLQREGSRPHGAFVRLRCDESFDVFQQDLLVDRFL